MTEAPGDDRGARRDWNRRMIVLAGLGFASGLPYHLGDRTLRSWLSVLGVDVAEIALFSYVLLPYALKFLWAPFLDRYTPLFLGRRRGWILIAQLAVLGALAGIAAFGPERAGDPLLPLALFGVLLVFASASQNIPSDAYRADVLAPGELGPGAAIYTAGFRVAMTAAGAGALLLAANWSWPGAYLVMAAGMGIGVAATLSAPRPRSDGDAPATLVAAIIDPWRQFFRAQGRAAGWIVLFVVSFKLPDALANGVVEPFLLQEVRLELEDLAWVRELLGTALTVVGGLAGGWLVVRSGLTRGLWVSAALMALSNLGWVALSGMVPSVPGFALVVAVESFAAGLVATAFVAYLMSLCDPRHSAVQYALLTSLMALGDTCAKGESGRLLALAGDYATYFAATVLAVAPGLVLLGLLTRAPLGRRARRSAGTG